MCFTFIICHAWAATLVAVCVVLSTHSFCLPTQSYVACRWCSLRPSTHKNISTPPLSFSLNPKLPSFMSILILNFITHSSYKVMWMTTLPERSILVALMLWKTENLQHIFINISLVLTLLLFSSLPFFFFLKLWMNDEFLPVIKPLWSLMIPVFTIPGCTALIVTLAFLACNVTLHNIYPCLVVEKIEESPLKGRLRSTLSCLASSLACNMLASLDCA